MNGRIVLGVLVALVVIAGAVGLGVYAYNAGVAQGLANSGKLVAPAPDGGLVPYYGYRRPFFFRPWGFGFGFLGCLFPLLFLLLIFAAFRWAFWGWRGGWGGPRRWEQGVPPAFEEWHRRAHEPQTQVKP